MTIHVRLFMMVIMLFLCTACCEGWEDFPSGCDETSEESGDAEESDDDGRPSEPSEPSENDPPPSSEKNEVTLPPVNSPFDYQIGGAYSPPAGVRIVSRDRNDQPAKNLYNICYINGFQVQPGEENLWPDDLILRDINGSPVMDSGWDEMLLDISTAEKRQRIAAIIGKWIKEGAADGFDAVEIDNLDSYTRSGNRLKKNQAVAMMALLSAIAHENKLAVAQKNSTELLEFRDQMGTDFAMAEECNRYDECEDYIHHYGEHVLMIEYRAADFKKACKRYGGTHPVVLRDLFLRLPKSGSYLFDGC